MLDRLRALASALRADARGNVLILFGFAIVPMVLATGIGIDYAKAARLHTKLDAIADAAALAAVTKPMMQKTDLEAYATAVNMFNAQASGLPGLVYNPANLRVVITPVAGATIGRVASVSYQANSTNSFSRVIGRQTIAIAGRSQASATKAPHIDFYVLLDTSPSMLLPSTSTGFNLMRTLTPTRPCAFACHVQNPRGENLYVNRSNAREPLGPGASFNSAGDVVLSDGSYADTYWLARNRGITLRIDAEQTAVQDLTVVAGDTATENNVTYRMAVHRFDYGPNFAEVSALTSNLGTVRTRTANLPLVRWWNNGCITQTNCINDMSTDFQTAFTRMNGLIPNPGTGATAADPQKMMFIITDGVIDESVNGGRMHRELQQVHINQCTAIKNRNIRIAILYTEYLPGSLDGDSWSEANVKPHLPNVAPKLQQCASPGLYYKVTTDESISDALTALFRQAVSTAHLVE